MKIPSFFKKKQKSYSDERESGNSALNFWLDIGLNLVIIIGLVFLIRTYIISPFQVYGPSMCDTLNAENGDCGKGYGEYIIVNKFGYLNILGWQVGQPERGDIIVFHPPHNDKEFYIKRVIGMPGETVELIDGYVYIKNTKNPNGIRLEEPYLNEDNLGNTHSMNGARVFNIPENSYFVMGDNRLKSSDSRSCFSETFVNKKCGEEGTSYFLTQKNIEGKAIVILWPLNKISLIANTAYAL